MLLSLEGEKRGFSRLYLRCLGPKEVDYTMREVHEGIFGNHSDHDRWYTN